MEPIRVLHVVTIMNMGGIESFLMNLYRSIDKTKIQFDFLVHRKEQGTFDAEIKSLGGKIYKMEALSPLKYFEYENRLKTFFKKNSEHKIVHSHLNSNSTLVLSIAKKSGIPIRIAHAHIDSLGGKNKLLKFILRKFLTQYSTFNFACATKAGKWLYGKKSFTVLNNAVDAGKFIYSEEKSQKIRTSLDIEEKIVFGNVGRFNTQKNHTFLIEVFEGIHKKLPNSHLLLIGDGNLRPTIEALVKTKGIENSVSFLGVRKNVNELLLAIDYILMPSLFEGLPVSLVEAQASGLRIFASDKISDETNITNNMYFSSIDDKEIWIDCILQNLEYKREDTFSEIEKAGYDVKANAQFLTEFYINEFKKINNQ